MSNEIAIRDVSVSTWQAIMQMAPTIHAAHMFGVSSPEQAAVVMLKGYEVGLGLAAAFEFIDVISNKPVLSPRGALALIHRSGELVGMSVVEDANQCTVTMRRRNGFEYTTTYTLEDATKAGLVKQGGAWEKYPKNMLRWRAIGYCADLVFPDVMGGLKRADEFGALVDDAGDVIAFEGDFTPAVTPPSLKELVDLHGTVAILDANGGRMPTTNEELSAIATALAA